MAVVVASSLHALAQQSPTPSRVRGTIEGVDGDVLSVKSRSGEDVKLHMTGDMKVVGIIKISLSDVKVGSFVGATTVPGADGSQKAVEVHVFPEDMRGTGEGSRPYDLRPNSTMTNATVAESVAGNDGRTLTVKYKDGEKKVVVGPDTPVVTYAAADKSDLKAGAKVIAFIKKLPDGSFETNRVGVGRDGLTPPM
jgi:molybdopterin-binding protein